YTDANQIIYNPDMGFFSSKLVTVTPDGVTNKESVIKKITKPAQMISIALFLGMVAVSFSQNFQIFLDNIFYVFFIVLIHNACALGTGFFGGLLAKVPTKDRRSLTMEVGIQNSGLGLILLFNSNIFPPEIWHGHYGGMLFITAWWGIWHIISGLSVATYFRTVPIKD
ncbi:MAG: hypothetical protein IKM58_05785, partial [Tidjanibacter sp.]|nr:hypothetical protein [Tidjanibacter sp.]